MNRDLGTVHVQLRLPHCWYRWGDEVVRILMPRHLQWVHEDPPRTTVTWDADSPDVQEDLPAFRQITDRVDELLKRYSDPNAIDDLIRLVYTYAPFRFQDEYRQLRNMFIDLRGTEIPLEGLSNAVVAPLLRKALNVFPTEAFPDFANNVRPFDIAMTALLHADLKGLALARELSEAFWFAFCYYLRVHPSAHENIPDSTVEYWTSSLPTQMAHYDGVLNGILVEAANTIPTFSEDPAISDLVDKAEHARDDDIEYVRAFDAELNDIGKFTEVVRRRRT